MDMWHVEEDSFSNIYAQHPSIRELQWKNDLAVCVGTSPARDPRIFSSVFEACVCQKLHTKHNKRNKIMRNENATNIHRAYSQSSFR